MQTQMSEAFKRVGVKSSATRLTELAAKIVANTKSLDKAVAQLLEACRDDAHLLWELMKRVRETEARQFLHEVYAKQKPEIIVVRRDNGGRFAGRAPIVVDTQREAAQPARGAAAVMAAAPTIRKSILDNFMVNGQPIGKLTAREVLESAKHDTQNARFKEMLCEGLPAEAVIGEYIAADKAQKCFELANVGM